MSNFSRLIVNYNSTANVTSRSNIRTYSTPTSSENLLILSLAMGTVALLGIVANSTMVILTKNESKYDGPIEEKKRRALLFFLIYNLSLADLMASLFSSTSLVVQQHFKILQSSFGCYAMRLLQYLFPTLSTQLLAVICLEKCVHLVWPFRSFPVKLTRKIVKCTWVSAIFWSFVISFSFKTFTINLENSSHYSLDCAQDLKNPEKKAVYITALFFTLLLPVVVICLTTTRSALVIRKFKNSLVLPTPRNPNPSGLTEKKVRSLWLVIWLVVIFGATCFPFILYQVIKSIVGQRVSHSTDFIIRYSCAILVLSNGLISPFMYYKNLKSIRRRMNEFLRKSRRQNTVNVHTFTYENVTYKPESLLQVPRVSLFEGRACGTLDTISADGFASPMNRPSNLINQVQLFVGSCP